MMDKVHAWFEGCGRDKNDILNRLTSDAVRQHRNKRLGDNSDAGGGEHNHGSLGGGLQGVLASHNASMVSPPIFHTPLLSLSSKSLIRFDSLLHLQDQAICVHFDRYCLSLFSNAFNSFFPTLFTSRAKPSPLQR